MSKREKSLCVDWPQECEENILFQINFWPISEVNWVTSNWNQQKKKKEKKKKEVSVALKEWFKDESNKE